MKFFFSSAEVRNSFLNYLREGFNEGLNRVRLAANDSVAFFRSVRKDAFRNVRSEFQRFVQSQGILVSE